MERGQFNPQCDPEGVIIRFHLCKLILPCDYDSNLYPMSNLLT